VSLVTAHEVGARPIRVALDAHTVGRRATGNESYIVALGDALLASPDVCPVVLLDRGVAWPTSPSPEAHSLRLRSRLVRVPLELPIAARRVRADVLHVQYVAPPISGLPIVAAIHDLSFEDVPGLFPQAMEARLKLSVRATARRAAAVVTLSDFSRQRLIDRYRLGADRVFTTPIAVSPLWCRTAPREQEAAARSLGIDGPFVLAVGDLHPRKNLPRLVSAVAALRSSGLSDLRVVLVGQPRWRADEVTRLVRDIGGGEWVTTTGFVDHRTLRALYGAALVVAHISLYEGFGLPVLEAMACGAIVVASSTTAIPETAGDAAVLVDPTDEEAVTDGLRRALTDETLRARLANAGPRRAASFSATRFAGTTVHAYRVTLG
jgi:glycosyltransferase involved in cell wall biosynthesis